MLQPQLPWLAPGSVQDFCENCHLEKSRVVRVGNAPQTTPFLPGFPSKRVLHLYCCFSLESATLGDVGERRIFYILNSEAVANHWKCREH